MYSATLIPGTDGTVSDVKRLAITWPVSGDSTQRMLPDFTPSSGDLWHTPGVSRNQGIVNRPDYTPNIARAFYAASLNLGMRPRNM